MVAAMTAHARMTHQTLRWTPGSSLTRLPAFPADDPNVQLGLERPRTHPDMTATI